MIGAQGEVFAVPAWSKGDFHSAAGQVVHDGPFLGHANRIVERQYDTAGPQANPFGLLAQGGVQDNRAGIQAPHLCEVPFRQPDGGKTMFVCEAGSPEEKIIFLPARVLLLASKKE